MIVQYRDMIAHLIYYTVSPLTAHFFFAGARTSKDIWTKNAQKDAMIYSMMKEWDKQGFDVILSPSFPFPAVSPDVCSKLSQAASYTAVYNLLGNPAGLSRQNNANVPILLS